MLKSLPRCMLGYRRSLLWIPVTFFVLQMYYKISQDYEVISSRKVRETTRNNTEVFMNNSSFIFQETKVEEQIQKYVDVDEHMGEELATEQIRDTTNAETSVSPKVDLSTGEGNNNHPDYEVNEKPLDVLVEASQVDDNNVRSNVSSPVLADQPHILLLSSMGRSGSSFLGGLLNSQPGTFYFYEPLHELGAWKINNFKNAVDTLSQLFHCKIKNLTEKAIASRHKIIIQNSYIDECGGKGSCMKNLNEACSKHPIRVIKTIRARVSWLNALMKDETLNFKVIHLLRDPRGSLLSHWKRGWQTNAETCCGDLEEDLVNGMIIRDKYPNRYLAVRYEDICAEPNTIAKILYSFLGHKNLPPSVLRYLDNNTSGSVHGKKVYGTKRNTRKMQQNWRETISQDILTKIEEKCPGAITSLGFNMFGTLNNARDFTLPLYNNKTRTADYFTYRLEYPESPP